MNITYLVLFEKFDLFVSGVDIVFYSIVRS